MNLVGPPDIPWPVREFEHEIRHLPFELLVAFARSGAELFRHQGAWDHVDLTDAQQQLLRENDVIVTHNHPLERSFSIQDLNMACVYDIGVLRAISPGHIYVLTPPGSSWDSAWCEGVLFRRGPEIEAEVHAQLDAEIEAHTMTVEQARRVAQHRTYERLANELAFGYWRLDQ